MLASVASMIDQFNMSNIRLLLEMGCEVHVACNFIEGNTCNEGRIRRLKKTLRRMRVVQHQWDCPRSICAPEKCLLAYRQLWRLTGKYQFDWIHCHSPVGGVLARVAGHFRGSRIMYTAHGFHFYQGAPLCSWLLYYPVEKLLSYWTDVLITVNKEDYQLAKHRLKAGKVYRIPGVGIDVRRFQNNAEECSWENLPAEKSDSCSQENLSAEKSDSCSRKNLRAVYGIPADAPLLLSVGELSRRKNHQAVLAALAGMPRQDVYYLICGQGSCRDSLLHTAQKYGLTGRIRLAGFLEDTAQAYQSADIFVFPSLQEGMPAALMEAMAAGLPCVVSDIRGNRELIYKKGGRRFPAAGKNGRRLLGKYLEELLEDEALRKICGRFNQKKIQAYDIRVVEKYMRQIYERAAGVHKSQADHRNAKMPVCQTNKRTARKHGNMI